MPASHRTWNPTVRSNHYPCSPSNRQSLRKGHREGTVRRRPRSEIATGGGFRNLLDAALPKIGATGQLGTKDRRRRAVGNQFDRHGTHTRTEEVPIEDAFANSAIAGRLGISRTD